MTIGEPEAETWMGLPSLRRRMVSTVKRPPPSTAEVSRTPSSKVSGNWIRSSTDRPLTSSAGYPNIRQNSLL